MQADQSIQSKPELDSFSRTSRHIFLACLAYTVVSTIIWLYFVITQSDGGYFFRKYNITTETITNILAVFLVMWVGWSYLIYRLKYFLLKKIDVSKDDLKVIFSNRKEGFDLSHILKKYPERKIRVVDMVGRRVRAAMAVFIMFIILSIEIRNNPQAESLAFGLQSSFLEAIFFSWWTLLVFYSNGILGRIAYGAHSRIMDGKLARANVLLIGTLWGLFKFIMIPIGIQLSGIFPYETLSALFIFIWLSYLASDTMGEVIGSIYGKQNIQVWGLGEVNKKSVAGTAAEFLRSLFCCVFIVFFHQLPLTWLILALVISISNTVLELYSPRGTDDFTMATTNALLCWIFGLMFYI